MFTTKKGTKNKKRRKHIYFSNFLVYPHFISLTHSISLVGSYTVLNAMEVFPQYSPASSLNGSNNEHENQTEEPDLAGTKAANIHTLLE